MERCLVPCHAVPCWAVPVLCRCCANLDPVLVPPLWSVSALGVVLSVEEVSSLQTAKLSTNSRLNSMELVFFWQVRRKNTKRKMEKLEGEL